jgi:AcrR family transcriptional regulator
VEPVQERSIATRRALLDAAVACLAERGYAATTTTEVARRAGVSRGAQLHHFSTKAELVSAAVDHLLQRRIEDFRKAFADLDPGADRIDGAIDLLWAMFEGPAFTAWAELWMAARTDPELAVSMVKVGQEFDAHSQAVYSEIFPPEEAVDPGLDQIARDFAFALMDGVAFGQLVRHPDQRPAREYIDALKFIYHALTPPETPPPPDPTQEETP